MKNKITLEYKDNMIVHTLISSTAHIIYTTQIPIEEITGLEGMEIFPEVVIYVQGGWLDIKANNKPQTKRFVRQIRKWMKEYHKEVK